MAKTFDVAYKDIENAFKYYLNHYNNGNRIVIAAHSQGQITLKNYLHFENDSILQKVDGLSDWNASTQFN